MSQINVAMFTIIPVFFVLTYAKAQVSGPDNPALEAREMFESRRLQLDFFIQQHALPDSLVLSLGQEADYFAHQEEWQIALELLNQAIQLVQSRELDGEEVGKNEIPTESFDFSSLNINLPQWEDWQWSLEMGSDYSRQEYEMSLIESDSVVLEQLYNPFVSARLNRLGNWKAGSYQLFGYVRADRELAEGSFSVGLESPYFERYWRVEAQSNLFYFHKELQGSFWDNQLRGSWSQSLGMQKRLMLNSQLRYKHFLPADSAYGNLFYSELSVAFRNYFQLLSWVEVMLRPALYREERSTGFRYQQIQGRIGFYRHQEMNRYLNAQLDYYYRGFHSPQSENDYQNSYQFFRPMLEAELPLFRPMGLAVRGELESRRYGEPDVNYSDFFFGSLSGQLKLYFSDYNSIGLGFVYELENHSLQEESQRQFADQEDYTASGLVVSADILKLTDLMLSFNYQYTLRTYPHAGADDLLGFYSNRRIHSLQGIGLIPLGRHWQFQFFANYDNDRDRDREANDNFNTIFNLGLIYKF
ncbi:MAG: hypothetical protein Kow0042_18220 [Calditrichia bacterium]